MAEIKPAEVSAILKQQLTGLDASASLDEVVLSDRKVC